MYETPNVGFSLAPDTVYEDYKPAKFFNFTIGKTTNYLWDFGDIHEDTGERSSQNTSTEYEPLHVYEHPGWKDVKLIAYNEHCSDTLLKERAILVLPRKEFIFPNVFRPNPGGPSGGYYDRNDPGSRNQVFFPGVADDVLEYYMFIYNRWGELVFESNDINKGWDGYINKRMAAQGVYVWKVKGKYLNGENFVFAGNVTLLH
ncbi:MAG: gliding motility-associated C-terminal domain-containing protein [Candidatus Aminicenantes bacterium]